MRFLDGKKLKANSATRGGNEPAEYSASEEAHGDITQIHYPIGRKGGQCKCGIGLNDRSLNPVVR